MPKWLLLRDETAATAHDDQTGRDDLSSSKVRESSTSDGRRDQPWLVDGREGSFVPAIEVFFPFSACRRREMIAAG